MIGTTAIADAIASVGGVIEFSAGGNLELR